MTSAMLPNGTDMHVGAIGRQPRSSRVSVKTVIALQWRLTPVSDQDEC